MKRSENKTIQNEQFLGDLEKTIIINQLMQISFEQRDEKWRDDFLGAIAGANLKLGDPEIITSNDGFPYIQLETISTGESFQAYVIAKQLDIIMDQGFGIVINAHQGQPEWVFSYGDLVNLKLSGSFYTDVSLFSNVEERTKISKDEDILVGQPSEEIFPIYLRKHIREFLAFSGVQNPKIMLIARDYKDEQKATQDLVFNITPIQFAHEKDFKIIMNTLQWFLPKHYSFFGADEMSIENGFQFL